MDILIRNMEMPKSCQECVYVLGYNVPMCPDDAILENYLEDERLGRHPSCPLVEVPPHGRLVDADANIEDFMNTVYSELSSDSDNNRANRIIDEYDNAPTVLEAST